MAKLVANIYGDALFELAVSENAMDSLYEEAQAVLTAFRDNEELGKLLNHPKIETKQKQQVIENSFSPFVSKNMTGLLVLMVEKARSSAITEALEYFVCKVKEHKGIGVATVTTATELSEQQKDKLVKRLLQTSDYKEFEMVYKVDPELLGGMVIRIKDRVVDSSVKTKLEQLAKDLKRIQIGQ